MKLTIAGYPWRVRSPSYFELAERADVVIFFDGASWRVAIEGEAGPAAFPSRDEAARMIADGINAWQREQWA